MTEEIEPAMVRRLVWLLGVPLASSFIPWVVDAAGGRVDSLGSVVLTALGGLPLLGALASRVYARAVRGQVRWWPLAPYAIVAATFWILLISAVRTTSGDGLEFLPVLLLGLFQPFLALVGGMISFVWMPRRD